MKQLYLLTIIFIILLSQSLKASGVKMEQVEVPEHIKEKFKNTALTSFPGSEYLVVFPPNDTDEPGAESVTAIYVGTFGEEATITLSFSATGEVISTKTIPPYTVIAFVSASEPGEKVLDPNAWAVRTTDRQISDKAMYVKSKNGAPITVYVGSFRATSSEGYMAIPISALGTRYIHCSYNDNDESHITGQRFHTGFICAAPYDHTTINIDLKGKSGPTPLCVTDGSGKGIGEKLTIKLRAGEVVNIWNKFTSNHVRGICDFTGSVIRSNNPIAVFSYHERTAMPVLFDNDRDNLVEQLLPTNLWGKEHISLQLLSKSMRYQSDLDTVRGGGDYFRVVSSEPNTILQAVWYDLKTGELRGQASGLLEEEGSMWHYRENHPFPREKDSIASITGVCVFTSDKPVQVMQYTYSTHYYGVDGNMDPSMAIVPPIEQYGNQTVFQTPAYEGFDEHHYNLIAKGDSKDPVKNNKLLSSVTIKEGDKYPVKIPVYDQNFYANNILGTDYYYASLDLKSSTVYSLQGHTALTGTIYGFGRVIAYAWSSSMALIEPADEDTLAPEVSHELFCNRPDRYDEIPGRIIFKSAFADTTNQPPASDFDDAQVDKGLSQSPALISPENVKIFRYFYENPPKPASDKWSAPAPIKKGGVEFEVEDINKDAYTIVRYMDRAGNTALDTMVYIADKVEWRQNGVEIGYLNFGKSGAGIAKTITISIKNIAHKEIRIDSVLFSKILPNPFSITNLYGATYPIVLGEGQEQMLDITYTPEDDNIVSNKLVVNTECLYFAIDIKAGQDISDIEVAGYTFPATMVNEVCSEIGTVKIKNSKATALYIKSIKLNTDAVYSVDDFTITPDINTYDDSHIEIGGERVFDVVYKPESSIPLNRLLVIDVEYGNNGDIAKAELSGIAYDEYPGVTGIDFGTVSKCIDTTGNFVISNESTTNALTVKDIVMDEYAGVFTITTPHKNVVIPAGGMLYLDVRFNAGNCDEEGVIATDVYIVTDIMTMKTTFKANPLIIPVQLSMPDFPNQQTGSEISIPMIMKMNDGNSFYTYANADISSYKAVLGISAQEVEIKNVIGTNISHVTDYTEGTLTISYDGMPLQKDDTLCIINALLLSGGKPAFDITFDSVSFEDRNSCIKATTKGSNITISSDIHDEIIHEQFYIEPVAPNPYTDKELKISYHTGVAGNIEINIYNSAGKLVKNILNKDVDTGKHSITVDIDELSAGTYIISMENNRLKARQSFVILK